MVCEALVCDGLCGGFSVRWLVCDGELILLKPTHNHPTLASNDVLRIDVLSIDVLRVDVLLIVNYF